MCASIGAACDDFSDGASSTDVDEVMVGSKEWAVREKAVTLSAERDGYHDGRQERLQSQFEAGLKDGFQLVSQLSFNRGCLSIHAACNSDAKDTLLHSIDRHHILENELVQSLLQLDNAADPDTLARWICKVDDVIRCCLPTNVISKTAQT